LDSKIPASAEPNTIGSAGLGAADPNTLGSVGLGAVDPNTFVPAGWDDEDPKILLDSTGLAGAVVAPNKGLSPVADPKNDPDSTGADPNIDS
jgi:hypothetical protein